MRCLVLLLGAHFGNRDVAIARLHPSIVIAEYLFYLAPMFLDILSEI
jgi:hypothetical protein